MSRLRLALLLFLTVAAMAALLGCERVNPVESAECQAEVAGWRTALPEANDTIERLNSSIEDTQSSAGSSYSEMNDALENPETGEAVGEP